MKVLKIMLLFMYTLLLGSCFNYRDMNKLFFATAAIVDVDETGNPVTYLETFRSYRGEAQENGTEIRVIFKGSGKTIYDSYINSILSASNEVNVSQIKALIFTERAAQMGIDKFIDVFERDQKPTVRMFLFVLSDMSPETFINFKIKDEQFLGLYLEELMSSQGKLSKLHRLRLNEYLNNRLLGSSVTAIPVIKISRQEPKRIEVDGAAVIKNDVMVSKLSTDEIAPYNYAMHGGTFGILLADNPVVKGQLVSLKVLRSSTKFDINYDGKNIIVNKRISITAVLIESQRHIVLNDSARKEIERSASDKLKYKCTKLFQDYKKKGVDIYNIARRVEIKYPEIKEEDVLGMTQLGVTDISVHIQGSNNTIDFQ